MLNKFKFPFVERFKGDHSYRLIQRQTPSDLYCLVHPYGSENPLLIDYNTELATSLGLPDKVDDELFTILAANLPENKIPTYATAYAGHQFGHWAGQLGDGRAIFLGEITNPQNQGIELQWKGAGATPYSRRGDGKAVFRSSLREYLMSEAMHYLNIPSTRALSLVKTGEKVKRDILYNGNADWENGAIVLRSSRSFLRFGHFELLSAWAEKDTLQQLLDYCIERYYPAIQNSENPYLDFFLAVAEKSIAMVIDWYRVGFVHGVMNTDNMSILGETIDYGPFSMLDEFSLSFTPNTTDLPGRRYAFGQQANILHYNLTALANALYPLIEDKAALQDYLQQFPEIYWLKYHEMLGKKFGFDSILPEDEKFFDNWLKLMIDLAPDYTLFFVELMENKDQLLAENFTRCFYQTLTTEQEDKMQNFLSEYRSRLQQNAISGEEALAIMRQNNPQFILRNYLLYQCIEQADKGDMTLFQQLKEALQHPYENRFPQFQQRRPDWTEGVAGCSMLSCSS